jgi:GNAT superfamily N-acetyltransferase
VSLVAADTLTTEELAELFTAGYEGYYVPINVDAAAFEYMVAAWDIDLSRSRVAPGEGCCNLAIRGERSWIGGIGVVPAARRKGLGRKLMEAVLEVAPPLVTLEVLEQNEPAIKLYESLGFERTRVLEVWSLPDPPLVEVETVDPTTLGQTDLPWQRADESLPESYERIEVDGGAMLFRGGSVLQLAAPNEEVAAKLLSRGTKFQYVNVPEGDVASAALRNLGGELQLRQHELILRR